MALVKNGRIVPDPWSFVADDASLPKRGDIMVTLGRWQQERTALEAHEGRLGLRLKAGELAESVGGDAASFGVIALEFPKFNDGRAYSTARLLRERHGYRGEIRAYGRPVRDQYLFMKRCGFDAVETGDKDAVAGWRQAMTEISVFYQPATDQRRGLLWQRQVVETSAACQG